MFPKQPKFRAQSKVGFIGEQAAASYLLSKQFRILERNFKARYGEIDIVAREGNTLVFVEVKTRCTDSYGSPEMSVTPRKLREVIQTAQYYVLLHPEIPDMRIDVVAIMLDPVSYAVTKLTHFVSVTS